MLTSESRIKVLKGFSSAEKPATAVSEFVESVSQEKMKIVVFFASASYDLNELEIALTNSLACEVIGCTTAGEIGPEGYSNKSITGFSIASEQIEFYPLFIESLKNYDAKQIELLTVAVQRILKRARREQANLDYFGLLMIDGLAVMEEQIIALLYNALNGAPIAGGSAGDELRFKNTYVYHRGKFHTDAAVLTLCLTTLPFTIVKTQHFIPTEERLVITKADTAKRIVYEINGRNAVHEYSRITGIDVTNLNPMIFSRNPLMLKLGGEFFVRSIQRVNSDLSLSFFCAIDEGLVLRVARGKDIVENLKECLIQVKSEIPTLKLVIGFDCILRKLEVEGSNLTPKLNKVLTAFDVIGFHTYGEQYNSVHVNQTFTGIAIGE
ncbi:FIST C-terminal domain-containing protein [bacterium]|nr:FIST C-terminal domain-containing protein [bacterium]